MITVRWALGVIVAASAASASTDELQLFSRLLKRQEPGTPEYNCHDNCGQAIIQARNSDDVCNDEIFVTDYENCLQCAGPDNVDIWRFYGNSLSRAAEGCGLSTTPLSGEQPDVGPAVPAGSSSGGGDDESSSAEPTEAPTSTADEQKPTATTTEEEQPTATSDEGAPSETTAESTPTEAPTEAPTEGGESYPTAVPSTSTEQGAPSATATATESSGYPVTPAPTASTTHGGNGTVSSGTPDASSTGVVPVAGAVTLSGSSLGFYGVLALGALLAFAQ